MNMTMAFPGGKAVDAHFKEFTVHTDQSVQHGGRGAAPEPFELFLASLGTCAGLFALRFCQQRGIDTAGLGMVLTSEKNPEANRVAAVRLEIQLPPSFPEKYREAIVRAVEQCTVKRHILEPPAFRVTAIPVSKAVMLEA
jgi:putative redox protein